MAMETSRSNPKKGRRASSICSVLVADWRARWIVYWRPLEAASTIVEAGSLDVQSSSPRGSPIQGSIVAMEPSRSNPKNGKDALSLAPFQRRLMHSAMDRRFLLKVATVLFLLRTSAFNSFFRMRSICSCRHVDWQALCLGLLEVSRRSKHDFRRWVIGCPIYVSEGSPMKGGVVIESSRDISRAETAYGRTS